jgi:hypothetical protein
MPRRNFRLLCSPLVLLCIILAGCKDEDDATDNTDQPAAPIAPDALRSRIDDAINYTLNQRLMTTRDQAAWQIVHGLEAFGRDLKIEADGETVGALDYLFKGNPLKGWLLRPGDKFPDGSMGIIAVLEPGSKTGEGHPDQWLGYLSQCGVQLDDPMVVGGTTYHVRDLMNQAKWDIYDGMEASWTLMAAATFLPLDEKWKAKDGREWSVERIVKMEAAQPLGSGGCYGSHRLYALSLAVNRYLKETGKRPAQLTGAWHDAQERINQAIERVKEYKLPDGTLSTAFFTRPAYISDIGSRLYAAGHTLEFLDVALSRDELADDWMVQVVNRLCDLLDQTRGMNPECGMLYHASHGLMLYRNARWGAPTK